MGPQADGGGEQQVPAIGQQLKKNILVEEREFMRMER